MEKVSIRSYRTIQLLVLSFTLLVGSFYFNSAKADTRASQPSGQQLAYFIGYHSSYYGPPTYRHHRHHRNLYWTGWRYIGHGCSQSCLIDRWSGRAIRCKRVCR